MPKTRANPIAFALALGWASGASIFPTSAHASGAFQFSTLYGQGFEFWSKVRSLTQGAATPAELIQLLDSSFDHPEEGMASFDLRYEGSARGAFGNLFGEVFNRAYFGAGVDGLAGGVSYNRILPDIDAYEAYAGHVDFGMWRRLPKNESGWELRAGSALGIGHETRVRGSAVELLGNAAPNNSALFYTGLDFQAAYRDTLSDTLRTRYEITLRPTFFHADFTESAAQYAIDSDRLTLRWRQESEWTLTIDTPFVPVIETSIIAITGAQPTPIVFLPRIWDAVHAIQILPSAGQLVGLGPRVAVLDPHGHGGLTLDGGFYGGYFGASALLACYGVQLAVGTYGLEQSAGYRLSGSRVDFVSLGGNFAF